MQHNLVVFINVALLVILPHNYAIFAHPTFVYAYSVTISIMIVINLQCFIL